MRSVHPWTNGALRQRSRPCEVSLSIGITTNSMTVPGKGAFLEGYNRVNSHASAESWPFESARDWRSPLFAHLAGKYLANMLRFLGPCLFSVFSFFLFFFPFCSVFFSSSLLCLCLVNTTLVVVQPQPSLAFFSASFAQLFSNFAAAGASCWHLMSLYRQFKILREPIFCGSSFRRDDKKRNVRNMERKSRHGR